MLEQEYQDSLNTLLPLKTQLMRYDKLIDRIVYQLYGLTEAEIAIVEGIDNPTPTLTRLGVGFSDLAQSKRDS